MLKGIPTQDYLQFERMRKDNSVRRIQRTWRNSLHGKKWECEKPLFHRGSIYTTGYFNRNGVYIPNTYKQSRKGLNEWEQDKENKNLLENFAKNVIEVDPVLKERRQMILKMMTNDISVASSSVIPLTSHPTAVNSNNRTDLDKHSQTSSNDSKMNKGDRGTDGSSSNSSSSNHTFQGSALCSKHIHTICK